MSGLRAVLLIGLLCGVSCDRADSAKAKAPTEDAPRVLSATERATQLQAELGVVTAFDAASTQALREVEKKGAEVSKAPPADLVTPETRKFTVFFGANNHGERNDCGCRKNPLGGLGRRHTMLKAIGEGGEIWEAEGAAAGPVFHLDAGDILFANNTVDKAEPAARKLAEYDAESVARAMATFMPDAMLVGEHDLVLGTDLVTRLGKQAKLPWISANLRADGELLFPASKVIERDGVKIGVVGVTKFESRQKDYWTDRKLTVDQPLEAAKAAIAGLPEVDAVVLLSNEGLPKTKELVDALRDQGLRVDLAVASSTNRMTSDAEFSHGVPVMEPLSRGKYVGRADFWLNGANEQPAYRNASVATPARLRDYRRAIRTYWSTKKHLLRERLKIAELEMSLETLANSQQPDSGMAIDELTKSRQSKIDAQKQRIATLETRQGATSTALLQAVGNAQAPNDAPVGDDWVSATVVPVKIEIEGEQKTRAVVDPREKQRPSN